MNVDRMKTKCGGRRFLLFIAYIVLINLSGCSPAVLLELLNEGDQTIYVRDFRNRTVAVPSHGTARVDLPGMTLVVDKPQRGSFDLRRVPDRYIHSTRLRHIIHAILREDQSLYLAVKTKEGKFESIRPQPEGFPIKGGK